MFQTLLQDLRYALRGLRTKPGFAIAVVLTLALGIGANAAMFGIVDRMLFRPPPMLKDPASVYRVYTSIAIRGKEYSGDVSEYAAYVDLATLTHSFSSVAGFTRSEMAIGTGDRSREMNVGVANAAFFGFFDAPPALGRYFTSAEDSTPAGADVTVLSYNEWQLDYGGRRDALGQKIQIGPAVYTIIGVAPAGFVGVWADTPPAYFIPITAYAFHVSQGATWLKGKDWWRTYTWGWMNMMARAKPTLTLAAINADLNEAEHRSYRLQGVEQTRQPPEAVSKPGAFAGSILPARGPNATSVSKVATWLAGVALIVLIIACANVANLLLARALRRRREIALRLALGVSRGRLLSQLLTESLLLAVFGGFAGLLVAQWGGAVLRATLLPKTEQTRTLTDLRTLAVTALIVVAIGVVTGLAPILQARRANLTDDLKTGAREGTYHRSRTRATLVVLQGALSVLLLVGAGLFVRSLKNIEAVRLGYDSDPVMLVSLNMRGVQLDTGHTIELRQRLYEAAQSLPSVQGVSRQSTIPFWSHSNQSLFIQGIDTVARLGRFEYNAVSPDYFSVMGTRILRGRGLLATDRKGGQLVMVVSDAMAKRLWPDKDAMGQCVRVGADTAPCRYVVGIAENIVNRGYTDDPGYYYYMPADQFYTYFGGLFLRTRGSAAKYAETVRRRLQQEMPGAAYVTITPLSEIIGGEQQSWRLGATMFVAFGGLAIVLAAIGLYSVIAYNVQQRTHEMGVRVALGAQVADVIRLVMSQGFALAGAGVMLGAAVSAWSGKWIAPLLFQESPRDPAVFGLVMALLLLVAAAASLLPAVRASRIDPQEALRSD